MPKFMMIICDDEAAREALPVEEQVANLRAKGEWFAAQAAAGRTLEGHRLAPARTARTVRTGKRTTTVDGPFAETKEQLGGYYLIQARDLNDAIQVAARIPSARMGTIEVRPIAELGQPA